MAKRIQELEGQAKASEGEMGEQLRLKSAEVDKLESKMQDLQAEHEKKVMALAEEVGGKVKGLEAE
eukprot:2109171-Rhodomonas_salina.1